MASSNSLRKSASLAKSLASIISETNGVSLYDTLELMLTSESMQRDSASFKKVEEFKELVDLFKINKVNIGVLLEHEFSDALFEFFRNFPLKYAEEHTHLTGAITADFIYPRLKKLLEGPNKKIY